MADQQGSQQVTDSPRQGQQDYSQEQQRASERQAFEQMLGSSFAGTGASTPEAWQSFYQLAETHFQLAEQVLHSARRVADIQTLSLMRQTIVTDVAQKVISVIKSDPSLIKR